MGRLECRWESWLTGFVFDEGCFFCRCQLSCAAGKQRDTRPVHVCDLTAFHFASYNALLAAATDQGANVAIALGGGASLTLDHVHKADLSASLFHL